MADRVRCIRTREEHTSAPQLTIGPTHNRDDRNV